MPLLAIVSCSTNSPNTFNTKLAAFFLAEDWRILRRAAHSILTPQACTQHLPIQRAEATQLMYDILKNPEVRTLTPLTQRHNLTQLLPQGFFNHVSRYSNSVILSVVFGKRAPRYETDEVWVRSLLAVLLLKAVFVSGAFLKISLIASGNQVVLTSNLSTSSSYFWSREPILRWT